MNEEHIFFHPINDEETKEKGPLAIHIEKHYRKHLFGLGILSGIALLKIMTILGSYLGITNIAETTNADYKPSIIETAIQTFDQIEELARVKDTFFHQKGKIYSYTGETLFHQLDTRFHILDNAYRSATDIEKKFKIAQQLDIIINQQSELFQSTQDINPDRDIRLETLDQSFHELQKQIQNK